MLRCLMEGVMAGSKSVVRNISMVKMHAILGRQQKFRATRIKAIILVNANIYLSHFPGK